MEVLIILSVAVSHLSVMLWGKGTDEFVTDSVQIQVFLGKSKLLPGGGGKTVDAFEHIINMDTPDCTEEDLYLIIYKLNGEIGAVFLKNPHKTPVGILVGGPVLGKLFSNHWELFKQTDGAYYGSVGLHQPNPGWYGTGVCKNGLFTAVLCPQIFQCIELEINIFYTLLY